MGHSVLNSVSRAWADLQIMVEKGYLLLQMLNECMGGSHEGLLEARW
jgi:hypothetical protein